MVLVFPVNRDQNMLSFMLLKYFNNFLLWRYKFGFSITFLLFSPRHMDYHYFFLQSSNWFKSQNNWTQNTESIYFILFYFFMAVSPIAVHYHPCARSAVFSAFEGISSNQGWISLGIAVVFCLCVSQAYVHTWICEMEEPSASRCSQQQDI